jgi:hypothetical protein
MHMVASGGRCEGRGPYLNEVLSAVDLTRCLQGDPDADWEQSPVEPGKDRFKKVV